MTSKAKVPDIERLSEIKLMADGNALQIDDTSDVGVTVASGTPAIVIQHNNAGTELSIMAEQAIYRLLFCYIANYRIALVSTSSFKIFTNSSRGMPPKSLPER